MTSKASSRATPSAAYDMKQADLLGKSWRGLSFVHAMESSTRQQRGWGLVDPIVASVCGQSVDYGQLFAYCFRRFGYPNVGWDSRKALVDYHLTTPHPDLVLLVSPYVRNTSKLSLRFLLTEGAHDEVRAYEERDLRAWTARAMDKAQAQGLPNWMPDWLAYCQQVYREAGSSVEVKCWRDLRTFTSFVQPEPGTAEHSLISKAEAFYQGLIKAHVALEPAPHLTAKRPRKVSQWEDADPLKAIALAAKAALRALRVPVSVRDNQIVGWGPEHHRRTPLREAPSAGYPSGALGNASPEGMRAIHELVLQLGDGDLVSGIQAAVVALQAAQHARGPSAALAAPGGEPGAE